MLLSTEYVTVCNDNNVQTVSRLVCLGNYPYLSNVSFWSICKCFQKYTIKSAI